MAKVKLKVELVDYTKNPEHLVAEMARICYADNEKVSRLFSGDIDSADDVRMIKILAQSKHLSPFEHIKYSYVVQGVSRALTHQLVRHRIATFSQRSQRYVRQKDFDYVIPPTIELAGMTNRFIEMMKRAGEDYEELCMGLEKIGLKGEEVNQDARFVLPNACETKIGITMNGRELMDVFFKERLCNRAQWEIRDLTRKMLEITYPTAPNIFSYTGPACYREGKCHQGKKCCGKAEEIKSYFESFKRA